VNQGKKTHQTGQPFVWLAYYVTIAIFIFGTLERAKMAGADSASIADYTDKYPMILTPR
jgi:hypothetical protein